MYSFYFVICCHLCFLFMEWSDTNVPDSLLLQVWLYLVLIEFDMFHTYFKYIGDLAILVILQLGHLRNVFPSKVWFDMWTTFLSLVCFSWYTFSYNEISIIYFSFVLTLFLPCAFCKSPILFLSFCFSFLLFFWFRWCFSDICENIFVCLFCFVYNIVSLSHHEQVYLMRLHFERCFSHYWATYYVEHIYSIYVDLGGNNRTCRSGWEEVLQCN